MITKSKSLIAEINKKLLPYTIDTSLMNVFISVVTRIYDQYDYTILPLTNEKLNDFGYPQASIIEWTNQRIVLNISAKNETVIWDLLHEFGHLQDGQPTQEIGNRPMDLDREKRGWALGRLELNEYPNFLESYDKRTIQCMNTYKGSF